MVLLSFFVSCYIRFENISSESAADLICLLPVSVFLHLCLYVILVLSSSKSVIKYDSGLSLMLPCLLFILGL